MMIIVYDCSILLLLSMLTLRKSSSFPIRNQLKTFVTQYSGQRSQQLHLYEVLSSSFKRRTTYGGRIRPLSESTTGSSDESKDKNKGGPVTVTTTPIKDNQNNIDDDPLLPYRNTNNRRDQIFSAISGPGGIKVTAVTARNIMNDLMIQHTMTATSTEALGRTVICSMLMANGIQDEQIVQITFKTEGPIRGIVAICSGRGEVRGYVGSPMLGNDVSLEDAVGRTGSVQIVKNHPDWPRPYNGITSVRHGDIDRDIGIYLAESEQRSCALAAATSVTGILCNAAGGYLIEQLPGTTDEERRVVEENLAKLVELDGGDKLPTNLLLTGRSPLDIVTIVLDGLDMVPLQQIEPVLKCECSEDRLIRSLRLLPPSDIDDILTKEERVEARCEFCGRVYRLEAHEVRAKLEVSPDDSK